MNTNYDIRRPPARNREGLVPPSRDAEPLSNLVRVAQRILCLHSGLWRGRLGFAEARGGIPAGPAPAPDLTCTGTRRTSSSNNINACRNHCLHSSDR